MPPSLGMTKRHRLEKICSTMLFGLFIGLTTSAAHHSEARIRFDAADRGEPIARNLFGVFTEHLGTNVYQGAWAQIVHNPEFVPIDRWPKHARRESILEREADVAITAALAVLLLFQRHIVQGIALTGLKD